MNQDERFQAIFERIDAVMPLTPVALEPALAEPKSLLKILKARHYNWTAERFHKLFGMRFSVKLPPLEQLNTILYPEACFDVPIFLYFSLLTRRKLIAHLGLYCPFDDEAYQQKYIVPMQQALQQYPGFDCEDRYPDWMQKYRTGASLYGMFSLDRLDDVTHCAFDYLDIYVQQLKDAEPVTDPDRLASIAAFHEGFRRDIRTQDKAQGMMARMIGKDTARRIFYEITT